MGLGLLMFQADARAVEPGVDIATPRVVVSTVDDSLLFKPAAQKVERGDYVRWQVVAGTTLAHTTTSGSNCVSQCGPPPASPCLWDANLSAASPQFTRQFNEAPGTFPYNCRPHCFSNMIGNVTVTTTIQVTAQDTAGMLILSWSGGGAAYQVFRSGQAPFPEPLTPLTPDGGDTGRSFTDFLVPDTGAVLFYLVMDK
jgi:plastocyanin